MQRESPNPITCNIYESKYILMNWMILLNKGNDYDHNEFNFLHTNDIEASTWMKIIFNHKNKLYKVTSIYKTIFYTRLFKYLVVK